MAITFEDPRLNDHTQKHEITVLIDNRPIGLLREVKGTGDYFRVSKPVRQRLNTPVMLDNSDNLKATLKRVYIGTIVEETLAPASAPAA